MKRTRRTEWRKRECTGYGSPGEMTLPESLRNSAIDDEQRIPVVKLLLEQYLRYYDQDYSLQRCPGNCAAS